MINQLAGHVWWRRIDRQAVDCYVFLQAGHTVYRCTQSENLWKQVDDSPDPSGFVFAAPLGKTISKCLTDLDGCKYVFFTDGTGIRIFDPPNKPGEPITIHSNAAVYLDRQQCAMALAASNGMSVTLIIVRD
ncbi:MAG: hypothetical protein QM796_21025 [Chthoniobacteraceae bacterium]